MTKMTRTLDNIRDWATGATLAEGLALLGAWDEYAGLLESAPDAALQMLENLCPPDDPEFPTYERAKHLARVVLARRAALEALQ